MGNKAIKELYNIIKVKDWTSFNPEKDRAALLDKWVDKWILTIEQRQSVINYKRLPLEHQEAIKYRLAQELHEQVAEKSTEYLSDNLGISANLTVIKREILK